MREAGQILLNEAGRQVPTSLLWSHLHEAPGGLAHRHDGMTPAGTSYDDTQPLIEQDLVA